MVPTCARRDIDVAHRGRAQMRDLAFPSCFVCTHFLGLGARATEYERAVVRHVYDPEITMSSSPRETFAQVFRCAINCTHICHPSLHWRLWRFPQLGQVSG